MTRITAYVYGLVGGYWLSAGYPPEGKFIYVAAIISLVISGIGYYLEKTQ